MLLTWPLGRVLSWVGLPLFRLLLLNARKLLTGRIRRRQRQRQRLYYIFPFREWNKKINKSSRKKWESSWKTYCQSAKQRTEDALKIFYQWNYLPRDNGSGQRTTCNGQLATCSRMNALEMAKRSNIQENDCTKTMRRWRRWRRNKRAAEDVGRRTVSCQGRGRQKELAKTSLAPSCRPNVLENFLLHGYNNVAKSVFPSLARWG